MLLNGTITGVRKGNLLIFAILHHLPPNIACDASMSSYHLQQQLLNVISKTHMQTPQHTKISHAHMKGEKLEERIVLNIDKER